MVLKHAPARWDDYALAAALARNHRSLVSTRDPTLVRLPIPPACSVKGEPFVEIEYENKQVTRIDCAELTVAQILEQVQSRAEEMDTAQVRCACEWVGAGVSRKGGA